MAMNMTWPIVALVLALVGWGAVFVVRTVRAQEEAKRQALARLRMVSVAQCPPGLSKALTHATGGDKGLFWMAPMEGGRVWYAEMSRSDDPDEPVLVLEFDQCSAVGRGVWMFPAPTTTGGMIHRLFAMLARTKGYTHDLAVPAAAQNLWWAFGAAGTTRLDLPRGVWEALNRMPTCSVVFLEHHICFQAQSTPTHPKPGALFLLTLEVHAHLKHLVEAIRTA